MTPAEARDVILYAFATVRDIRVKAATPAGDGLTVFFADGSVAAVTITVTPGTDVAPGGGT